MSLPFLHVVAALLIRDGKVFIARRALHDSSGGKWEFPGGKVEEGEAPHQALEREMQEELNLQVRVLGLFGANRFQTAHASFLLELYFCNIISGDISLVEHIEFAWAAPADLNAYDFLSGDLPFILQLKDLGALQKP